MKCRIWFHHIYLCGWLWVSMNRKYLKTYSLNVNLRRLWGDFYFLLCTFELFAFHNEKMLHFGKNILTIEITGKCGLPVFKQWDSSTLVSKIGVTSRYFHFEWKPWAANAGITLNHPSGTKPTALLTAAPTNLLQMTSKGNTGLCRMASSRAWGKTSRCHGHCLGGQPQCGWQRGTVSSGDHW